MRSSSQQQLQRRGTGSEQVPSTERTPLHDGLAIIVVILVLLLGGRTSPGGAALRGYCKQDIFSCFEPKSDNGPYSNLSTAGEDLCTPAGARHCSYRNSNPDFEMSRTFSVSWRIGFVTLILLLLFQLSSNDRRFPAIDQVAPSKPEPEGSKYSCSNFYFIIGVGDGTTIAEFINGTNKSWSADRPTRAMVGYRIKNNLPVDDFCVFGFEPNEAFSDDIFRTVKKYRTSVSYLHVFTSTVPGSKESIVPIGFNKTTGKVVSWGSAAPSDDSKDIEAAQTQMIDFGNFLNLALGEKVTPGRVLMSVDMEGAEVMIVRDILPLICKHVLKLEIEYHNAKYGRKGICAEWMLHFMLSSPKCRPRWKRPAKVPEECDVWGITENFDW